MPFNLVTVVMPDIKTNPAIGAWATFHSLAKVDALQESVGVFYISDTAWIFDTRKALEAFSEVTLLAIRKGIQLYVFPLDIESLRFHALSSPKSEKLEAFLSS